MSTEDETGMMHKECTVCGTTIDEVTIDKLGKTKEDNNVVQYIMLSVMGILSVLSLFTRKRILKV